MAVSTVVQRILKWGMKLGATWGTPVSLTTGDQIYPHAMSGFDDTRPNIQDMGAGVGRVTSSFQKPQTQPTPSFTLWPYEADQQWILLLGLYYGDDVVTGAGDPYTHTMEEQDESAYYITIKFQEGDEVKGAASYAQTTIEIAPSGDGIIEFVSSGLADGMQIFTNTDLDTVTKTAIADPYEMENVVFRVNNQGGSALSSGDEIELTNFKITMSRPQASVMESGNTTWSQPKQGAFPEFLVEIELEAKTAAAKALYAAFTATPTPTMQKLDFVFSGTSADRELKIECPAAKIESAIFEPNEIVNAKFTFRCQKATSAPTGMTGVNNTAIVKTSYATDILT